LDYPTKEVVMRDAVIVDAVRTPIGKGKPGGALHDTHPVELLAHTLRALVDRTGIDPATIDDVIGGAVDQVGEQAMNTTRWAALTAGLPESVPATTVDRQCGSSQQAAHFAAQGVIAGAYDLVIACGVESMSRVGSLSRNDEYVDRLADAIVGIEYYMETLQAGRGDPWYMLDNAERCLAALDGLRAAAPGGAPRAAESRPAAQPPAGDPTATRPGCDSRWIRSCSRSSSRRRARRSRRSGACSRSGRRTRRIASR
jgi:hypothetical protein